MLTDQDQRFLEDRERRNRLGRTAMIAVTAMWVALWVWFAVRIPLLVNPIAVAQRLRADDLDPAMEGLMAAMCPLLFDLVGVLVLCFLVFALLWVRLEKRYLRMLKGQ